jgi:hypothetical protein
MSDILKKLAEGAMRLAHYDAHQHAEGVWNESWKKLYRQGLRAVRVTLMPSNLVVGGA